MNLDTRAIERDMKILETALARMGEGARVVFRTVRPALVGLEVASGVFPERYRDELAEPEENVFT